MSIRRASVTLLAVTALIASLVVLTPMSASAETPGFMTITKRAPGLVDRATVEPGDDFVYEITITCSNTGSGGCTSATFEDEVPEWLDIDEDAVAFSGSSGSLDVDGQTVRVDFTTPLSDPAGGVGLADQSTVTIQIPVTVNDDIPADLSGTDLVNTARTDATNFADGPIDDTFTVVPDIPVEIEAATTKGYSPPQGLADPGSVTELSVAARNASNVPVERVTFTDPTDPSQSPNPFDHLSFVEDGLDATLPVGADLVQVDVFVGGSWEAGTPTAAAELPAGVDPADVRGIRVSYISTDGADIDPGAAGTFRIALEQRGSVTSIDPLPHTVDNTVTATVSTATVTSDPATNSATYEIVDPAIDLAAHKEFRPPHVVLGGTTEVVIGATNTSDLVLDSMTITEPAPGTANIFDDIDPPFVFEGFTDEIRWPNGATSATITYQYDPPRAPADTQTTTTPGTLPEPADPDGTVIGFTVVFEGPIAAGGSAELVFDVTAPASQLPDEVVHSNEILAGSTAPGGFIGEADDAATITSIIERLSVVVDKSIAPTPIWANAGERVVAMLSATLEPAPASTVNAREVIVQDPPDSELGNAEWWDSFSADSIVATPIPADSTMTVEYWDGTTWVVATDANGDPLEDIPGLDNGYNAEFSDQVRTDAQGIRFVYTADADSDGFEPGAELNPNIGFTLDATSSIDFSLENCAAATAENGSIADDDELTPPDCPTVDLMVPDPGDADLIDKEWLTAAVGERTGAEATALVKWSTGGFSDVARMELTDVPDPDPSLLDTSVFDVFDLVRIDGISPSTSGPTTVRDPLIAFDMVASVQLYSRSENRWVAPESDPCAAPEDDCDGFFPGYTLTADERADTIAFRLVFVESPTRSERIAGPLDPQVGSGVARSFAPDRPVRPVFELRNELRSDPDVPVVNGASYNIANLNEVSNTAGAEAFDGLGGQVMDDQASSVIPITPTSVIVGIDKTWTGGPLGVPPAGTPSAEYPSGRVRIVATNDQRDLDRFTITDPTGGTDPFDVFDLARVVDLTPPEAIGATEILVTLDLAGGGVVTFTDADDVLAASADDLADVVGIAVAYSGGRIRGATAALLEMDLRLRERTRSDSTAITSAVFPDIDNRATVLGEDLIGYPSVTPETLDSSDSASIELDDVGIDVVAAKSFTPDEQTHPDDDPIAVTISGRPAGVSRTNRMVLADTAPTFWNQYDFVGFDDLALTSPIDRVQVDVLAGGTWSVDAGEPVLTGATWRLGTPAENLALPTGVTAAQVQGLRFTFTRDDGHIWENPANPLQAVVVDVQRRDQLNTGGPVLDDTPDHAPAPGETTPGVATNTVDAQVWGADLIGGTPITATDDAEASVLYRHLTNSVSVTKSPHGSRPPGTQIPFELSFTNTGDAPIVDPVIEDLIPSDGDGPMLELDPAIATGTSHYSFELDGPAPAEPNGEPMPTEVDRVTVTAAPGDAPSAIRFEFPPGSVIEPGQTYTVTIRMVFRAGLPGNTVVDNVAGITGSSPWDTCVPTLDPSGRCEATATVEPTRAGALRGDKQVRAADPSLGVVNGNGDAAACVPDAAGYYRGSCTPVVPAGGDAIWRMRFGNTGNLPIDGIYAVDRLPEPGDTGAIIPLARDSEYRPLVRDVRLAGVVDGAVSRFDVFYTSDAEPCTGDLRPGEACDPGNWELWTPEVDPFDVRGLKFEMVFADEMLEPRGYATVEVVTTNPSENTTGLEQPVAWNTVAAAGRTNDGGTLGLSPQSEGNRVGITMIEPAVGVVEVVKVLEGDGADKYGAGPFQVTLGCTLDGAALPIPGGATRTLVPGVPARYEAIPAGATCTATESATGNASQVTVSGAVQVGEDRVATITVTNSFRLSELRILKRLAGPGASAHTGDAFTFSLSCVGPSGAPIEVPGGAERVVSESSNWVGSFTDLLIGSTCRLREVGSGTADQVSVVVGGAPTVLPGDGVEIAITGGAPRAAGTTACQPLEVVNLWGAGVGSVVATPIEQLATQAGCVLGSGSTNPGSPTAAPPGGNAPPVRLAYTGGAMLAMLVAGAAMVSGGLGARRRSRRA